MKFKIPLQSEVAAHMKNKKGWPEEFCSYYAERFWNHYTASGWKLSNGNSIKDWKACFNAQWQTLKFKEDIEFFNKCSTGKVVVVNGSEKKLTEIEKLNEFLANYRKPGGADIPFEEFGKHYDYMKVNNFLLKIDQSRVEELLETYKGDKYKCRCWCVRATFEMYINSGLTFTDIIKMRERLNGSNTAGVKAG